MAIKTASGSGLSNSLSSGLVLLNTTTFSGVASQTVSNIFTSAYKNYFLTLEATGAADLFINYRLTTGGTPNSTSNYHRQRLRSNSTTVSADRSTESVFSFQTAATRAINSTFYIFAPEVAQKTFVMNNSIYIDGATFTNPELTLQNALFNLTTQFDGIQLLPNTSTITGTLKVYGLS
jgi:hypothetical protein